MCKSRELRGGNLIMTCECLKRNGLQNDCPRTECQAKPCCLTKPEASCCPSRWARRYRFVTMGRKSNPICPSKCTIPSGGGGCNPCPVGPCCPCPSAPCPESCCVPTVACDPCCGPAGYCAPCGPVCDPSYPPVCDPACAVPCCDPYSDCCVPCGPCGPC